MSRVSYVNGRYLPHGQAAIHIEDRGFQLADAVYEVLAVSGGAICHLSQHLDRLERSLGALAIGWPVKRSVLPVILTEVVRRNRVVQGLVYIQISRGIARRNHLFPADAIPTLVVSAWSHMGPPARLMAEGASVVTRPEQRWKRPDIKTVGLLPNLLAKQSAKESGAFEAWFVDERGYVTEGSATNAYMVGADGALITHPADHHILGGVTRSNILMLARQQGIEVGERPFTLAEALAAREAFISGTTTMVLPVTSIDGQKIGDGRPGPVTQALRQAYEELRRSCRN